MGRRFDIVSTIGKHNKSYVIRPDITIIKSLGWNFGDQVEIFPIPEKGILCIEGKDISKEKFKHNFEENYMMNNKKTELKKILNKLKTLRNKSTPLDWIFEEGRKELRDLIKEIERWDEKLNGFDKIMSNRQMGLEKAANKINKDKRPIYEKDLKKEPRGLTKKALREIEKRLIKQKKDLIKEKENKKLRINKDIKQFITLIEKKPQKAIERMCEYQKKKIKEVDKEKLRINNQIKETIKNLKNLKRRN